MSADVDRESGFHGRLVEAREGAAGLRRLELRRRQPPVEHQDRPRIKIKIL